MKGSEKNGPIRKPVLLKLKVTMSTSCIPVQNQSPKRNKEVCTDESDEKDFNVFPPKCKLKQVLYSDSGRSEEVAMQKSI